MTAGLLLTKKGRALVRYQNNELIIEHDDFTTEHTGIITQSERDAWLKAYQTWGESFEVTEI